MPLSATACGSVSAGTCSLTEACQAGPNNAMPLPTMKHSASSTFGVTRLSHASTVSAVAPTSAIESETSATMRRSCMSAMAPAGIEISMIGSISAVCTNATLSAEDVICVIAQAAPTPWIKMPRLETQAGEPDPPEHRMPQRRRDAVGGKTRALRLVGHGPFRCPSVTGLIPFAFKVMPAKTLPCPVVTPPSVVPGHS